MVSKKLLLLLFAILGAFAQNMISDGDFESSALGYHPSSSTWYSFDGTGFVISNVSPWTNALSLLSTPNTTICQKVQNFRYKRRYTFSFSVRYQASSTLANSLFFYYYKNSFLAYSRPFSGSVEIVLVQQFQASNINNQEIFCFKSQANLTRAPNPLTQDLFIDNLKLNEDLSSLIQISWNLTAISADGLSVRIDTNLTWNTTWDNTTFFTKSNIYENSQIIVKENLSIIQTAPFSFSFNTATPLSIIPSNITYEFADYQLKDSTLRWLYFSRQRLMNLEVQCWVDESEFINNIEITTDFEYQPDSEALMKNGAIRLWIDSQLVDRSLISFIKRTGNNGLIYFSILVKIQQGYRKDKQLTIEFDDGVLRDKYGSLLYISVVFYDLTPAMIYFHAKECKVIEQVLQQIVQLVQFSHLGVSMWNLVGLNFFIGNFITFLKLPIFYIFMPLPHLLKPYRVLLNSLFLFAQQEGLQSLFLSKVLKLYSNTKFLTFVPEKLRKDREGHKWTGYFGFSINLLSNIWDQLLSVLMCCVKLLLIKLFSLVPIKCLQRYCSKLLKLKAEIILFEIVLANAKVLIVFGDMLSPHSSLGYSHYKESINFASLVVVSFFLLLAAFMLFILQSNSRFMAKVRTRGSKANKMGPNNLKTNRKKIKFLTFIDLYDNLLFVSIPFSASFFNQHIFLILQSIMVISRLVAIVRIANCLQRYDFIKQMINKSIWLLYNVSFLMIALCFSNIFAIKYGGASIIVLLVSGIISQILFLLIDFCRFVYQHVTKPACLKARQIKPEPGSEPSCDIKKAKILNEPPEDQLSDLEDNQVISVVIKFKQNTLYRPEKHPNYTKPNKSKKNRVKKAQDSLSSPAEADNDNLELKDCYLIAKSHNLQLPIKKRPNKISHFSKQE